MTSAPADRRPLPLAGVAPAGSAGNDNANSTLGPFSALPKGMTVFASAVLALLATTSPSLADLKLCNATTGRIGVAIGYQDGSGWATEGWWSIPGQTCETLLKGRLGSRFYYVHAIDYDRGGEWAGKTEMCVTSSAFTIRGNTDCEKRGFRKSGFMEVDTTEKRDWTIKLTDPVDAAKPN